MKTAEEILQNKLSPDGKIFSGQRSNALILSVMEEYAQQFVPKEGDQLYSYEQVLKIISDVSGEIALQVFERHMIKLDQIKFPEIPTATYTALSKQDVINRLTEMRPKFELPDFDESRKSDHVYCVEWGMEKQKMIEQAVYDRYIEELNKL